MPTNWILIALLVVILIAFIFMSISRRKKEEAFRKDLESKMVPGAKVKTYSGLYGTIISVTETTDGKIVLLETGEGKNVSYQTLHINAIFGLDTKQPVRYDSTGNIVLPEEAKTEEKKDEAATPAKKSKAKKTEKAEQPETKQEPKHTEAVAIIDVKEEKPASKKPASKKTSNKETKAPVESLPAEKKTTAKKTTKKTTTDKK